MKDEHKTIGVQFPASVARKLKQRAKAETISISAYIRRAIMEKLSGGGNGN